MIPDPFQVPDDEQEGDMEADGLGVMCHLFQAVACHGVAVLVHKLVGLPYGMGFTGIFALQCIHDTAEMVQHEPPHFVQGGAGGVRDGLIHLVQPPGDGAGIVAHALQCGSHRNTGDDFP